jgi:hypothetical protein
VKIYFNKVINSIKIKETNISIKHITYMKTLTILQNYNNGFRNVFKNDPYDVIIELEICANKDNKIDFVVVSDYTQKYTKFYMVGWKAITSINYNIIDHRFRNTSAALKRITKMIAASKKESLSIVTNSKDKHTKYSIAQ